MSSSQTGNSIKKFLNDFFAPSKQSNTSDVFTPAQQRAKREQLRRRVKIASYSFVGILVSAIPLYQLCT